MSTGPDSGEDEEDRKGERLTASLGNQLREDAASWYEERRGHPGKPATGPKRPVIERSSPLAAGKPKKPSVSPLPVKLIGARSKPFSMSYGGVTEVEYIQYMLDRGSR